MLDQVYSGNERDILLNQRIELKSNLFSNDSVCELGITFEYEKKEY